MKRFRTPLLCAFAFSALMLGAWFGGRKLFAMACAAPDIGSKMKLLNAAAALGCAEAVAERGIVNMQTGRPAQAWADFGRVIRHSSGYPAAYIYRAEIAASFGNLRAALDDYNQAMLKMEPYLRSLAQNSQAQAQARARGSNLAEVSRGLYGRILRGRCAVYARLKRFGDALVDAGLCVEIAPEDWRGYAARAAAYSFIGQDARAAADVKTAVKLGADKEAYLRETEAFPPQARKLAAAFAPAK
ncbi:MAG: hypothetical protein WC421_00735 [Elusimicrobiales bacterium]